MSINRGMDKDDVTHVYNGTLLSHKKNEMMPFTATWMNLQTIILSEMSQKDQDKYDFIYMWNLKKMIQMKLITKLK